MLLCRQSLTALLKLKELAEKQLHLVDTPVHGSSSGRRSKNWWSRLSGRFTREDAEEDPLAPELAEKAAEAASSLGAEAHSMDGICYDPRLVTFEFVSRLVLRKKQVSLVKAMQAAVKEGEPLVHQMLMGEGKTTVVTPLVILVHGSAMRSCVVCVPQALTEFTVRVLRERLCATLSRPVTEFTFNRATPVSDDHFFKLLHAQDARAVMVSGPTALKSLMLRFVLTLHACDVARSKEEERLEKRSFLSPTSWKSLLRWPSWSTRGGSSQLEALGFEARALAWALEVFRGSVLILDDIDLLMHPLRSELHWPLGAHHHLDFTQSTSLMMREDDQHESSSFVVGSPVGARWQLAFHLLDGFFSCGGRVAGPATTAARGSTRAMAVLSKLEEAVQRGLKSKQLQQAPHLVLLSLDFYHKELRPILAEWALIWLKSSGDSEAKLLRFWCSATWPPADDEELSHLSDAQLKAVNLIRSWLQTLFPHLASRIHRVHYGLLDEASPSWPSEAPARRHMAVPFVGKDAPSDSSQFSHPDVLIGLTWLAYRFGGMRPGDLKLALRSLGRLGRLDSDGLERRSARQSWTEWVKLQGAAVRGGEKLAAEKVWDPKYLVLSDRSDSETQLVPPLEWLDSSDASQVALVYSVMKTSPFLMEFHLHQVFPALLKHADAKLSANGQDLGGEVLSSSRLGFSGTPNDLLPRSLGQCRYAQGDDAKMLTTLSDPLVVQVSLVEEGWNAQRLLQRVATHQPPLNALIDVGALITGLSNEQVARALLDYGLPFEAVVFCDSGGGQQLLRRTSATAVKVSNCTLPLHRRFVFYDQVHTTGIDIRHPAHACAALTLGKDSTFRDFAQGAYRLRGIKKGQRLQVLVTPEVAARIEEEVPMAKRDSDVDAWFVFITGVHAGQGLCLAIGPPSLCRADAAAAALAASGAVPREALCLRDVDEEDPRRRSRPRKLCGLAAGPLPRACGLHRRGVGGTDQRLAAAGRPATVGRARGRVPGQRRKEGRQCHHLWHRGRCAGAAWR
ncbi:Uncharacterized protein SCF082_LOCUS2863 [Durusdinium trenchii]|uniref:ubiquitinyl hydrolase 1 n=1 Tax=Durusdinium trenchii TaxID=1381693 RepID=A0ABP0HR72_9DINO